MAAFYGESSLRVRFTVQMETVTGQEDWWMRLSLPSSPIIQASTSNASKTRVKIWCRAWAPGSRDSAPQQVQMAGMKRPKSRRPHSQGQGCR